MVVLDNTIVNVALPTLSEELGATTTDLQWIVDSYTLVFSALLLALGHFGDRRGRKGALQLGIVIFALTSVLAALAQTSGELITARALMGIGAALVFPATLAILVNVFTDRKERAAAIGLWSAVTGIAVACGPVAGGLLLEHFWWGSVFLVNLPVAAVALVAGAFLVPKSKDPAAGPTDWLGLVTSAAGIGLLVWAIIEGPRVGWLSAASLGAFAGAALLLVVFVRWERRRNHPLLDVSVFTNARFTAASVSVATAFFGLFGFIFLITQYMQLVQGYSPLEAGVRTVPFAVATAIAAPLAIALMHRFGTKLVVAGGLLLMGVGFVLAANFDVNTAYLGPIMIAMMIMGAGLGLATGPATESIMDALPADKAGVGSAVNDTTREIGGTLGVAVVGSVFASIFAPQLREALAALAVPGEIASLASESMGAAVVVAGRAPAEVSGRILEAAQTAFVQGFGQGSLVAAGAVVVGAVVALAFLPARHREG
jgi:EmrB/QacA subfamily drug resistance transporter